MAKDRSKPLLEIDFHCTACRHSFSAAPGRVEDAPELHWHPFAYFATCAKCDQEVEQSAHQRSLLKAWAHATGPRTAEGKAATAKNLIGHPTTEETRRTRFNAMKHGMNARTATYFPSKPDGYSRCKTCDVDREWCAAQPACVKQTELFMTVHAAFESRDSRVLTQLFADQQAGVIAIVQQIMQTILADGVTLTTPVYSFQDGELVLGEYYDDEGKRRVITEVEAHPLLSRLAEFLAKAGLSLTDMGMTPRQAEDEAIAQGVLQATGEAQETLKDFAIAQAKSLDALRGLMQRADAQRSQDPVLQEYRATGGGKV